MGFVFTSPPICSLLPSRPLCIYRSSRQEHDYHSSAHWCVPRARTPMASGFLVCLIPRHFSCDQMPSLKSTGAWNRSHSISANSHCCLPHLLGLPPLPAQLPFSFPCRLYSNRGEVNTTGSELLLDTVSSCQVMSKR